MNDLLSQVTTFIASYEAKAKDVASQGTAALRKLADVIDAQIAGLKFAGPDDAATCSTLAAKCCELCPECDPKHPKGFGLPGNPILTLLFQILQTALAEFAKQQPTTPPAPTPAT